jgi:ribosomal-protein-alanine acetyltransferase
MTHSATRAQHAAKLRRGRAGDLAALVTIETAAFATDRLSERSFRHFLASPTAALIIADDGSDRLAGYALVLFLPRSTLGRLYSIAVAPHLNGHGIGSRLLAAAEDAAKQHGRQAMRLEVHENNALAIALYQKSGYRFFGRRRDYYGDHGDALRFEKPLDARRPPPPRVAPPRAGRLR